jgi:hypothetical protein
VPRRTKRRRPARDRQRRTMRRGLTLIAPERSPAPARRHMACHPNTL